MVIDQRGGVTHDGTRYKNHHVPDSIGIATRLLITAIHQRGLVCLEHTLNPMKFLGRLCKRPDHEEPVMIISVGDPAEQATVPALAKRKTPLDEIASLRPNGCAQKAST